MPKRIQKEVLLCVSVVRMEWLLKGNDARWERLWVVGPWVGRKVHKKLLVVCGGWGIGG